MKEIQHKYFGILNLETDDDVSVIWEKEINGIQVWLWYSNSGEVPDVLLDSYAQFLVDLDEKIKEGRRAIIEYLNNDRHYIDFHIEELDLDDLPSDTTDFANQMSITNLGLWINNTPHITMDFMINPDLSDEILCVKFGKDAKIIDIAWES
ncbi:DUF2004 domain-containing protein [Treponema sp. OMZ 792]|uniref:DUF2004 domain-containing protein n=1 Tax=unclassified Treponema TaxID=2638727 RepID=UPI0020A51ED7|nr:MULTISPECIES: DUF2004 domain-containing protein [unclassified Treponema]UTC74705.1 DUF2004 domain-containing protein [Treponema sp. OMZ 792]UTC76971.1 DUF2004 domain-containing protein [Treponema sp. OMZ 799]UTC81099.1 DUF2004 domain-containing protein [Treponema sp. OMZ 798]